jgi:hypothetical protein
VFLLIDRLRARQQMICTKMSASRRQSLLLVEADYRFSLLLPKFRSSAAVREGIAVAKTQNVRSKLR